MRTWVALVGAIALCAALSTLSSLRVSDLEANRRVELRQMARHRLEARSIGVSARWRTSGPAPAGGAPADEAPADEAPAPDAGVRSAVPAETARPAYLVPAAPVAHAAAASRAVAPGAYSEAAAVAAGCTLPRRPYHTVLTSSSGLYQAWQSKIAYHHYKLQKARDPCGEMGGFTRLLTSPSGKWQSDDADMPTVVVSEVRGGYPVVNRPHSMLQFVGNDELFRKTVKEEYVYIAETDHILLRPLPNLATQTTPAAFHFGYMVADGQAKIVEKFVRGLGGKTDPVGPSPLIIHVNQLRQVVEPWRTFTEQIMKDAEAVAALGWVREMWGYAIAAASLGIKHRVLDAFQFEGGSIGNRNRPLLWPVLSTPVGAERADMPYYILHYTYGIEYSAEGLPMELQVGEWSLDKRAFMGHAPARRLVPPPACAHDRGHLLTSLFNNASATIPGWTGGGSTSGRRQVEYRSVSAKGGKALEWWRALRGTGPWELRGRDGKNSFALQKVWLLVGGWAISTKGHGRWSVTETVHVSICRTTVRLVPDLDGATWTLKSVGDGGATTMVLKARAGDVELWRSPLPAPPPGYVETASGSAVGAAGADLTTSDALRARVEGSGPYRGPKHGEVYLLRAGVVHAQGQSQSWTRWRALDGRTIAFHNDKEEPTAIGVFVDCYVIRILGANERPLTPDHLPPLYKEKAMDESMEWIIRPAAVRCEDPCAGLTLRKLTDADYRASPLAQALAGCCGWSWAGFGGLQFHPEGKLQSPWGGGLWGAPPEMQKGKRPAILAEFAGSKHLLRAQLSVDDGRAALHGFESTRCADNDAARVQLTSGKPPRFEPLPL